MVKIPKLEEADWLSDKNTTFRKEADWLSEKNTTFCKEEDWLSYKNTTFRKEGDWLSYIITTFRNGKYHYSYTKKLPISMRKARVVLITEIKY